MRDDGGRCGVTPVVWALVLVEVTAFFVLWRLPAARAAELQALLGVRPRGVTAAVDAIWNQGVGALWIEPTAVVAEIVLPFLTAPLLACGPAQLALAIPFLLVLGRRLEARGGGAGLVLILGLGAMAAGMVEVVRAPAAELPRCGPAGAVSALVAAYCVSQWRSRVVVAVPVLIVPVSYQLPSWVVGVAWGLFQIPAIQRFLSLGTCAPTSWEGIVAAVIVGAVAGLRIRQ